MTGTAVGIDLWQWSLDCDATEAGRRSAVLSEAEQARAERFVHDRDRIRFISGRSRLRGILSDMLGTSPSSLTLHEDAQGKPFVQGGPVFNLSHSAGLAALAVSLDQTVWLGVDIEGLRPVDDGLDALAFAPEEREALRAVAPSARQEAFFLGWTRKEAVVKATGKGLRADLQSFAVSLQPGQPACLLRMDSQNTNDWRLHDFRPRADIAGAIACRTSGREIRVTRRS